MVKSKTSRAALAKRAKPSPSKPAKFPPPRLSKDELPVFDEAMRRGEETRNTMEDALVAYGSWLLVHVFGGDTTAALEHRKDNAIWLNLLARAGGKTLRLHDKFLNVAVRIAAYDKRLQSESWRLLEPSRKELLLPLGDEKVLRRAAAHVIDASLGYEATRTYVANLRAEQGERPKSRMTAPRVTKLFVRFREKIADPALLERVGAFRDQLQPREKKALRDELRAVKAAVAALESELR